MTGTGTIQDRPGALMPINKEVLKKKKKSTKQNTYLNGDMSKGQIIQLKGLND